MVKSDRKTTRVSIGEADTEDGVASHKNLSESEMDSRYNEMSNPGMKNVTTGMKV